MITLTIKEVCAGKLVDRKSKFYPHLYQIENLTDDIQEIQKIHN